MRFSSRLRWQTHPSAIADLIAQRRLKADDLLDLTVSNPTDAGIQYPATILQSLADPRALRYRPAAFGLQEAREAVAIDYYRGRYSPEQIVLSASTSEAYSWLFRLLCDPGDEVLIPRPSYPLFEYLAQLECVRTVQYPMHYAQGWFVDLDAVQALITPRTRAIVFVNPNNPTGSYLKPVEWDYLRVTGLPLIFDEVFLDYALPPHAAPQPYPADFVLSGLSKVSGLPQMKIGWIVVNNPEALPGLELIGDTFLSVNAPVQQALPTLLGARHHIQSQIRARTRENLEFLRAAAAPNLLDVEGGWSAVLRVPRVCTEEEWVTRLVQDYDVLVQPGYFYDFEDEAFLVVSLLTQPDTFAEGVRRTILACNNPC
jgi:alanine-synthesizing transaminase